MTANLVLIIGSTAALGQALAEEYAKTGCPLMLAARDLAAQREIAADLRLRYAMEIHEFFYDANDATSYHALIDSIVAVGIPRRLFFVVGAIGESDDLLGSGRGILDASQLPGYCKFNGGILAAVKRSRWDSRHFHRIGRRRSWTGGQSAVLCSQECLGYICTRGPATTPAARSRSLLGSAGVHR